MGQKRKAILLNDTSNEQHVGCTLVVKNIHRICKDREIDIIRTYTRKDLLPSKDTQPTFDSFNFVIVNGEGSLHHSPQCTTDLLSFAPGKPKILVNTVWEKMYCCSDLLSKCSFISVRESHSYNEIIKSVPKEKVEVVPDLIFFDPTHLKFIDEIGFGDSVMTRVCDTLKERKNFFPMQRAPNSSSIGAYISWMKSLGLYVTGRFHGVCLAMILNVPFLAIPSNSHKIEGILEDADCSDLIIRDLSEIEEKKDLAFQAVGKTKEYAENAHKKISMFFDKVFKRLK